MQQFAKCLEQKSVVQGALMPDTHSGYVAPIGSVIKTKETIFPSFVGYDIGCGMTECKLDIKVKDVSEEQFTSIRDKILDLVPIGFNRHSKSQQIPETILNLPMTNFAKQVLKEQGSTQIGTLGGGNHFLELGTTNDGYLSIVVHSGSRGVGHKTASHHMKIAATQNTDKTKYGKEFDNLPKNRTWLENCYSRPIHKRQEALYKYEKARKKIYK